MGALAIRDIRKTYNHDQSDQFETDQIHQYFSIHETAPGLGTIGERAFSPISPNEI